MSSSACYTHCLFSNYTLVYTGNVQFANSLFENKCTLSAQHYALMFFSLQHQTHMATFIQHSHMVRFMKKEQGLAVQP
ncbi:hypothetical protein P3451_23020, partial [Vibrio parahaemolyticus]|nr:hypothetical protein [Vibrio parahaemolyticus]